MTAGRPAESPSLPGSSLGRGAAAVPSSALVNSTGSGRHRRAPAVCARSQLPRREATRVVAQWHPPCGRVRPPADRRTWLPFGTTRVGVPPSPRRGSPWARTVASLAQTPGDAAAEPTGRTRVLLETAGFPKRQHGLTPRPARRGPRGLPTLSAVESSTSAVRGRVADPASPRGSGC